MPGSLDHAVFGPLDYGLGLNTGRVERVTNHESHAKSIATFFIAGQSGLAEPVLSIGSLTPRLGHSGAPTAVIVQSASTSPHPAPDCGAGRGRATREPR
ncbi:hypothetical protein V9L19_13695 [Pseudarthrobacter sp. CCNWLW247]